MVTVFKFNSARGSRSFGYTYSRVSTAAAAAAAARTTTKPVRPFLSAVTTSAAEV